MTHPLGRRAPTDWSHIDKYPLGALPDSALPTGVPVQMGTDWFVEFDSPQRDSRGHWWVARDGKLTKSRGGHSYCLLPAGVTDLTRWWTFYDQGREGACVGFAGSRMMSLLNRRRYEARWLWNAAKAVDEWPDTNPGDDNGTSVRAAFDVLRSQGIERYGRTTATLGDGIAANRWATSADQVLAALGTPERDYVVYLNSWGRLSADGKKGYPHFTRMPAEVLDKLIVKYEGEAGVPVDR